MSTDPNEHGKDERGHRGGGDSQNLGDDTSENTDPNDNPGKKDDPPGHDDDVIGRPGGM